MRDRDVCIRQGGTELFFYPTCHKSAKQQTLRPVPSHTQTQTHTLCNVLGIAFYMVFFLLETIKYI